MLKGGGQAGMLLRILCHLQIWLTTRVPCSRKIVSFVTGHLLFFFWKHFTLSFFIEPSSTTRRQTQKDSWQRCTPTLCQFGKCRDKAMVSPADVWRKGNSYGSGWHGKRRYGRSFSRAPNCSWTWRCETLIPFSVAFTYRAIFSDPTFIKTFLMTYKSFTNLEELFDLLVKRFWIEPPDGLNPRELEEWEKLKQHVIRMR